MTLPSGLLAATPKTPRSHTSRRASLRPRSPPRPPDASRSSLTSISSGEEQKLRRSSSLLLPPSEASLLAASLRNPTQEAGVQMHFGPFGLGEDASKYLDSSVLQKSVDESGVWNSTCILHAACFW